MLANRTETKIFNEIGLQKALVDYIFQGGRGGSEVLIRTVEPPGFAGSGRIRPDSAGIRPDSAGIRPNLAFIGLNRL